MIGLFDTEPQDILPFDGHAILYPDLWGAQEAAAIFERLKNEVEWQQPEVVVFGRRVLQPRLTAWFGDDGCSYTYSGATLNPAPWTPFLSGIRRRCEEVSQSTFNSVLLNLYRGGSDAVSWHSDDEPALGEQPVIASVSLGATRRFDMRHRESGLTIKTNLGAGSLLVMSGRSQSHWKHQVPRTSKDIGPRINMTFRRIHV
jgi:alkylated DNA repair dioxygenase AlkB